MAFFDKFLKIFWPKNIPLPTTSTPEEEEKLETKPESEKPEKSEPTKKSPPDISQCREWRLTDYYLAVQSEHRGSRNIPILDRYGQTIEKTNPGFFSSLALEGSGVSASGKLLNVAGTWTKCNPDDYAGVWAYHQKYLSKRPPAYSGLQVQDNKVTKVLAFHEVPHDKFGKGFGVCNGIPMDPYRTLAADIGKGKKSDPLFKSLGGVAPIGTEVYIKEFDGMLLPDETTHDGWFVVNDTGGGIFGAHFDVFVGYKVKNTRFKIPPVAHVWFKGIEKLPTPYTYGLRDV